MNISQFSNADKSKHGTNAKKALIEILDLCKKQNYIKSYDTNFRCGYPKYDNSQFFCNFLITFNDETKWIINTTTSLRDRVKENQWDSFNIKEIVPEIQSSVLVYPDEIKEEEREKFVFYNYRIENGEIFSAIDYVVSQAELFELIENTANSYLPLGKMKDKVGTTFENLIVTILQSRANLEIWNTANPVSSGTNYPFFKKILEGLEIQKGSITKIQATCDQKDIGLLLSGGSPKTDIIVTFSTESGSFTKTISCKKSKATSVSVHQYDAKAFSDVLDPDNKKLLELLTAFQNAGGIKALGAEKSEALKDELKQYNEKLIHWVLGGSGGKIQNENQIAQYLLVYDENRNDIYIHSIDEYTKLLLLPEHEAQLGTPFQWTFASGRKGKDIQLKCVILN